jgi:uncharacterized membrane protein YphA (DoxX/SURF4 family)
MNYKKYAPLVARLTVSLVFLWFGLNQVFDTTNWLQWLPPWTNSLPIAPATLVLLNGVAEIILGAALLMGFFVRPVAFLLALHLAFIAFIIGYNDVGVRDLGLSLLTLSVALHGPDQWCKGKKK